MIKIDLNRINKKKAGIIAGVSVGIIILLVTVIALLNNENKNKSKVATSGQASAGNMTVNITEEKSSDETDNTTKESENTTKEPETTTVKEADNSQSQPANETPNLNQSTQSVTAQLVQASSGALHVSGRNLMDSNGNIVQLRGISTHGIGWFPEYINNTCFKQLHEDFNANVIRLAMYSAEYNGYCTGGDKEYLKGLVDKGVTCATENDMYVIIDWHILSDNDPGIYADQAREFFNEMSAKYANHTNVLYEICNEPNGGTSWSQIKSYAVSVIDIIKRNDPDAVIIVGTPTWSQEVDKAVQDPITGYSNIMYSLHFYAATHTDALRNTCATAADSGLPIFVTEFGICDSSGNGAIDENQAGAWISLLNNYNISYCMWSLCNKAESASAINSSCTKVSGFNVDDLSQSGKWFLKMMTGGLDLSQYENEATGSNNSGQQNSQNQSSQSQNNQNNQSNQGGQNQGKENVKVSASINLVNSWEANGKKYCQYNITATNNSGEACSSWYTDIDFKENITLDQSWNGNVTVNGKTVHITSVDYNGSLASGGSTDNIGIIVAVN